MARQLIMVIVKTLNVSQLLESNILFHFLMHLPKIADCLFELQVISSHSIHALPSITFFHRNIALVQIFRSLCTSRTDSNHASNAFASNIFCNRCTTFSVFVPRILCSTAYSSHLTSDENKVALLKRFTTFSAIRKWRICTFHDIHAFAALTSFHLRTARHFNAFIWIES